MYFPDLITSARRLLMFSDDFFTFLLTMGAIAAGGRKGVSCWFEELVVPLFPQTPPRPLE